MEIATLVAPEDRERVLADILQGHESAVEHTAIRKDGTRIVVEANGRPVYPGSPRRHTTIRDITARKQTEATLLESEQRYRLLFQSLQEGFYLAEAIFDAEGNCCDALYLDVNPAFEQIMGLSREQIVGKRIIELVPRIKQEWLEVFGRVTRTGEAVSHQTYSDVFQQHFEALVFRPEPGKFGVLVTDITDRKQAEEALRANRDQLDLALVSSRMATFEWNILQDKRIWSDGVHRLMGTRPESFRGTAEEFFRIMHPEDRGTVQAALAKAIETDGVYETEYRVVWPDGSLHHIAARGRIHRDDAGRAASMTGVCWDITDRKLAEEAVRKANEQLRDADRRKDEFLAMLAHELRNPLSPVLMAVEIMRLAGPRDPILMRQRDVIARQVGHMARLLDDLLDVSRITRGKIQLKMQPLHMTDVFLLAMETAAPLIQARRQTLSIDQPPDPLRVYADPHRLAQVIGNLLVNAAKFTEEGGCIWLSAAREEDNIIVRVRDTGAGIAPEMLPHIFDLFTQADQTLDRSRGGLGIGLTMVRSLVEMHGGRVEAHSEGVGRGSEFVIILPAEPDEAGPLVKSEEPGELRTDTRRFRILVVDDIQDSADSLAQMLSMSGHDARAVHDGSAALDIARAFHPEVVLLDIGMPVMDGYEVARALRAEHGNKMTLVALTGYAQAADREAARNAGFNHHLAKPVDLQALGELLIHADSELTHRD